MKKILIFLSAIVLLVIVAGVYKFNFTNDDIIVPSDTVDSTENVQSIEKKKTPPVSKEIVVKDFEGEANPEMMKLDMKKWNWVKTVYSDDKIVTPKPIPEFTLTLDSKNNFLITDDCTGGKGTYTIGKDKSISFNFVYPEVFLPIFCGPGSGYLSGNFEKMLKETQSYMFTSKGELVLMLKYDSGSVIFR